MNRNCTIRVAKTKALFSCAVTAVLFSQMQIVACSGAAAQLFFCLY